MAEISQEEPHSHSSLLGMYITYVLHPDDNPTHPTQQWHGRVKQVLWIYSNMSNVPQHIRYVLTEILDEDWTGYDDLVRPSQILEISPLAPINPRLQP